MKVSRYMEFFKTMTVYNLKAYLKVQVIIIILYNYAIMLDNQSLSSDAQFFKPLNLRLLESPHKWLEPKSNPLP